MEHIKDCPVCGSDRIEQKEEPEALSLPYGPDCVFSRNVEYCSECGESGDFSGINDSRIEKTLSDAVRLSIISMIDDLSRRGLSMAYLERSLDLPQRTLSRLKGGEYTAAALALLRIIRTYPWIAQVAESGYDPDCANSTLVSQAVSLFDKLAKAAGLQSQALVVSNETEIQVHARFAPIRECSALQDSIPPSGLRPWFKVAST